MLSRLLSFGLAIAAAACAAESNNDAPIIDQVDAPLSVTAKDGAYSIPISLLFHDNDGEAITRLRYRLPPNVDGMIDVPAPNPTKESAQVTIVIPVSALDPTDTTVNARGDRRDDDIDNANGKRPGSGRGRRALQITIMDGRGAESLPLSSTVTLD